MYRIPLELYFFKLLKKLRFRAVIGSKIHRTAKIYSGCHIVDSEVGRYSDIGYDCRIYGTKIGAFCSFGTGIAIGGSGHTTDWVSTSTAFNLDQDRKRVKFAAHHFSARKQTSIGNDVWIGDGVLIKSGVSIGDGAVIGMGAVVTKDVPPYEIWGGNQARCIRKRFPEEVIAVLVRSRWWEWPENRLREYGPVMNSPDAFIKKINTDQASGMNTSRVEDQPETFNSRNKK